MKCIVPSCTGTGKVFPIPPDKRILQKWQKALDKALQYKNLPLISLMPGLNCGICQRHFDPSFIVNKKIFNTHNNSEPPWLLATEAVPSFSGELSSPKVPFSTIEHESEQVGEDDMIMKNLGPLKNSVDMGDLRMVTLDNKKVLVLKRVDKKCIFEPSQQSQHPDIATLDPILINLDDSETEGQNPDDGSSILDDSTLDVVCEGNYSSSYPFTEAAILDKLQSDENDSPDPTSVQSRFLRTRSTANIKTLKADEFRSTYRSGSEKAKESKSRSRTFVLGEAIDENVLCDISTNIHDEDEVVDECTLSTEPNDFSNTLIDACSILKKIKHYEKLKVPQSKTRALIQKSLKDQMKLKSPLIPDRELLEINQPSHEEANKSDVSQKCSEGGDSIQPLRVDPLALLSGNAQDLSSLDLLKRVSKTGDLNSSVQSIANSSTDAIDAESNNLPENKSESNNQCPKATITEIKSKDILAKSILPSSIKNTPSKKICVIPLENVVGNKLSRTKIQEFIKASIGKNVPFNSPLFKIVAKRISCFKKSYKKKVNSSKHARRARRERSKNSDARRSIVKRPRGRPPKTNKNSFSPSKLSSLNNKCQVNETSETVVTEDCLGETENEKDNPEDVAKSELSSLLKFNNKNNSAPDSNKNKLKRGYLRRRPPRSFTLNFSGKSVKEGGNPSDGENILSIPATITNVYDKSQLEVLCQTLIETLYRFQNTEIEGAQVNLVVSIKKIPEKGPPDKLPTMANTFTVKSSNTTNFGSKEYSIHEDNEIMDAAMSVYEEIVISDGENIALGVSTVPIPETSPSEFYPNVDQMVTQEVVLTGSPVDNEVIIHESDSLNTNLLEISQVHQYSESCDNENKENQLPNKSDLNTTVYTCHDHSYSPGMPGIFKNPRYLVRVMDNSKTRKGFGRPRTKVVVKPPPKKLIQKHEKEKERLQKLVDKLLAKVKSKNSHIVAKNKKIKYLSTMICEEKGLKRIRYPKDKKQKSEPSMQIANEQVISEGTTTVCEYEVLPDVMTHYNIKPRNLSSKEEDIAVEHLIEEVPYSLDKDSGRGRQDYYEDNFDKRFTELYQHFVEIGSTSQQ